MKPKELIKILKAEGWNIDRIQGSHYILKHPSKPGRPVIPYHNKDLKPGILNSILKQTGLK
ncbi:type II toxin-antitoxin system HicA family toxin [Caldicellulosiruptoraceae bacterium PP1]